MTKAEEIVALKAELKERKYVMNKYHKSIREALKRLRNWIDDVLDDR